MVKAELLLGVIGTGTGTLSFVWLMYRHFSEKSKLDVKISRARRIVKREDDLYGSRSTEFRINLQVVNVGRLPTCIRKIELNIRTKKLKTILVPLTHTKIGFKESMDVHRLDPYSGKNLELIFFLEKEILDVPSFPCEIAVYDAKNKSHRVKFFSDVSDK